MEAFHQMHGRHAQLDFGKTARWIQPDKAWAREGEPTLPELDATALGVDFTVGLP